MGPVMGRALMIVATIALLAACRGENAKGASRLAQESLANMLSLRSYRLEMEMDGRPIGAMEFLIPARYRFVTPVDLTREGSGVVETVWAVDFLYYRRCKREKEECEPWQKQFPTPIPIGRPDSMSVYVPGWPLTFLEMAQGLQRESETQLNGKEVTVLKGQINHVRAFLENYRRAYARVGRDNLGEECTQGPSGEKECRPITLETLLERQKDSISYYDAHPATIWAWIGAKDGLLYMLRLQIPPFQNQGQGTTVAARFLGFNEVVVDIPVVFPTTTTSPTPTP